MSDVLDSSINILNISADLSGEEICDRIAAAAEAENASDCIRFRTALLYRCRAVPQYMTDRLAEYIAEKIALGNTNYKAAADVIAISAIDTLKLQLVHSPKKPL